MNTKFELSASVLSCTRQRGRHGATVQRPVNTCLFRSVQHTGGCLIFYWIQYSIFMNRN